MRRSPARPARLDVFWKDRSISGIRSQLGRSKITPDRLHLDLAAERLPTPPNPPRAIDRDRSETAKLGLHGVAPGSYRLVRDGKAIFEMTVPPGVDEIDLCLNPDRGPDAAQAERLREV